MSPVYGRREVGTKETYRISPRSVCGRWKMESTLHCGIEWTRSRVSRNPGCRATMERNPFEGENGTLRDIVNDGEHDAERSYWDRGPVPHTSAVTDPHNCDRSQISIFIMSWGSPRLTPFKWDDGQPIMDFQNMGKGCWWVDVLNAELARYNAGQFCTHSAD